MNEVDSNLLLAVAVVIQLRCMMSHSACMQRMPACQLGIFTHLIYDVIESLLVKINVRVICHERNQEALELAALNGTRLANVV